nr:MAG TPA: hypothetical protein [Caudoviricetes sp.]
MVLGVKIPLIICISNESDHRFLKNLIFLNV